MLSPSMPVVPQAISTGAIVSFVRGPSSHDVIAAEDAGEGGS